MNSINIFELTRVSDVNVFTKFEMQLSNRDYKLVNREYEIKSISSLVDILINKKVDYGLFDNFYYSYAIPQIGKEFDLLRINDSKIINIELKSEPVSTDKIKKQLQRNRYYLSHLSLEVSLFTFIEKTQQFYQLTEENDLELVNVDIIIEMLDNQSNCYCDNINSLFKVSDFLISPLNTPEKFVKNEYFLTSQQECIKKDIFNELSQNSVNRFIGITGGPGTGKTLFLYDLAFQLSESGKCCIIHCGILSEGHNYLKRYAKWVDIIAAKDIGERINFSVYKYIFIDESHRIYKNQLTLLIGKAKENNISVLFSYDSGQILSKTEKNREIEKLILGLPNIKQYCLSGKIRTNKEMASFISKLFNLKLSDQYKKYTSVSVGFANNEEEAKILIKSFEQKGYIFINYTESIYNKGSYDNYEFKYNTHHVIGQEFDRVLMVLDSTFYYDEDNMLVGSRHPNPDYLYKQLLFQGLTRVREKLALIIIGDNSLFGKVLSIF